MRKTISKICTIFFILASLLPMNWSMDIDQTEARSKQPSTHGTELVEAAPPPQIELVPKRLPLDFDQHNKYMNLSNKPYRISWELDVDFPEGIIRAKWIFRIEQETPANSNNWMLTDEYIQNISCDKHGEVQIGNGYAEFNQSGNSYITCETPNFKEVAMDMIKGIQMPGRVCTECLDPWMNATINGRGAIGYLKPTQQVDGKYSVFESTIRPVSEGWKLYTNLTGWGTPEMSHTFQPKGIFRLWTGMNIHRFLETLKARQDSYPTPWTNYWSMVNDLPNDVNLTAATANDWFSWVEDASAVPTPHQEYEFSNGAHTFYIGHNPDTDEYFNGIMYNIGVDPGCIGN